MHIGLNTLSLFAAPGGREVFFLRVAEGIARLQPESQITVFTTVETANNYSAFNCVQVESEGELRSQVRQANVDVLFSPIEGALSSCPVPQTVLVMDLSNAAPPKKKRLLSWGGSGTQFNVMPALEAAHNILVPSDYVRRLLQEKFEVGLERVSIAPLGVDPVFEANHVPFIEPPYILSVGCTAARRPVTSVLNVFNAVCANTPHTLVVVGRPGENEPSDWGPRVIRIEYVPQNQLAALYQHADVAIIASTWEGSGVAVLESLRSGTLPVCPRIGGIPEMAHNAPVYYNPESESDMLSSVRRAMEERPAARQDRVDAGRKSTRAYTWDDCTWKTLQVLSKK